MGGAGVRRVAAGKAAMCSCARKCRRVGEAGERKKEALPPSASSAGPPNRSEAARRSAGVDGGCGGRPGCGIPRSALFLQSEWRCQGGRRVGRQAGHDNDASVKISAPGRPPRLTGRRAWRGTPMPALVVPIPTRSWRSGLTGTAPFFFPTPLPVVVLVLVDRYELAGRLGLAVISVRGLSLATAGWVSDPPPFHAGVLVRSARLSGRTEVGSTCVAAVDGRREGRQSLAQLAADDGPSSSELDMRRRGRRRSTAADASSRSRPTSR